MIKFTIPLAPVTKKNSQRIVINRKTGRPMVMPSAAYKQYEKEAAQFIPRGVHIETPVNVKMVFNMPTRRRVDLVNLEEAALDIMVKCGLIADDNSNVVVTMDGSKVVYNKENPHTEITITELEILDN